MRPSPILRIARQLSASRGLHFESGLRIETGERVLVQNEDMMAMNPIKRASSSALADWPWSIARALLACRDDGLVEIAPLVSRCGGRSHRGARSGAHPRAHARPSPRMASEGHPPVGSAGFSRPARGADRARSATAGARPQAAARGEGRRMRSERPWSSSHAGITVIPDPLAAFPFGLMARGRVQ
jgi:hypothetical protein